MVMAMGFNAQAQQFYVKVTGTNVRLRSSPTLRTNNNIIYWTSTGQNVHPAKGALLPCYGSSGNFWYVYYAGTYCYISKDYAKRVSNGSSGSVSTRGSVVVVNGVNVRLRYGPGLNYAIYSNNRGNPIYPSKGSRLTYLGQSGNWYKVRYNGQTLYISKDYSYLN